MDNAAKIAEQFSAMVVKRSGDLGGQVPGGDTDQGVNIAISKV